MATYREYAKGVFLSVAVGVAGVLWFDREDDRVYGEDIASLHAGRVERQVVPYATGTGAITWPSNNIVPYLSWQQLYTDLLKSIRTTVTNEDRQLPSVYWLDASVSYPADDTDLCTSDSRWYPNAGDEYEYGDGPSTLTAYTWRFTDTTNGADAIPTTATRLPCAQASFWPGTLPRTNAPLCEAVYEGCTGTNLLTAWTPSYWWPPASNNVYGYYCEYVLDYERVLASQYEGSAGLNTFTNQIKIGYWDWNVPHPFYFKSTSALTTVLNTAVFYLSCQGRESCPVAVTDSGTALGLNMNFSAYTLTLGEGVINSSITVQPRDAIPAGEAYVATLSCSAGFDAYWFVFDGVRQRSRYFGPGAGPANIFIEHLADADKIDDAGCVIVKYRGEIHALAVGGADDDGVGPGVTANPVIVVVPKLGSNYTGVTMGVIATNTTTVFNRHLKTRDLDDAKAVLEGMTRTIWIGGAGELVTGTCTNYSGGGYDSDSANGPSNLGIDNDAFIADVVVSEDSATPQAWNGVVASYLMDFGRYTYGYDIGGPSESWLDNVQCDIEYDAVVAKSCTLPYPNTNAFATGYVKNMRIYACAAPTILHNGGVQLNPLGFDTDDWGLSASSANMEPSARAADAMGTDLRLAPVPDFGAVYDLSRCDQYTVVTPQDLPLRLTLIGEYNQPLEAPKFDLGVRVPAPDHDLAAKYVFAAYDDVNNNSYDQDSRYYRQQINITHFVVIVDWAFAAYGDTNYVGTAYTPAWMAGD